MSAFSSGKRADLIREEGEPTDPIQTHEPLTNPANPILAAMRTDLWAWHDRNAGIRWWLKDFDVAPWVTESRDPAQVTHARAVLTRLAVLGGAS